jgi:hypothetical protein
MAIGASDADAAGFERLAEGFEGRAVEFGELIQKKNTHHMVDR